MNVAKWLLVALLALPFMELAAFVAVAAAIGFAWALALLLAGSLAGALVLRQAGVNHIARVRVAMAEGGFTAVQADSRGFLILLAGILLLIPGFITMSGPAAARRAAGSPGAGLGRQPPTPRRRGRSCAEQWRRETLALPSNAITMTGAATRHCSHRPC
jgi:UPF0716 protein FxsA